MSKKKHMDSEGGGEADAALTKITPDQALSVIMGTPGAPNKISLMTADGTAIVRRGDEQIPTDAQAIITAGSRDSASQAAEAEARRKTTGEIISTREILKSEVQGQVDQLNNALKAKDTEIARLNVEYGKLRDENTRLLGEIADLKAGRTPAKTSAEPVAPVKKKKKKHQNIGE